MGLRIPTFILGAFLIVAALALPLAAARAGPPDVSITPADIVFSNEFPKALEQVTINVTVHNIGGGPSGPVTVDFYQGQVPFGHKTIANIDANATGAASALWIPQAPISYDIIVRLNCTLDTNAANNQASRTIAVGQPGGLPQVAMTLDPASCKPSQLFWANGTVRIGTQPQAGASVTVAVKPSGTPVVVTTDTAGAFAANLTAPSTAGRYEVEASASVGQLKGNDTKTLSVVLPDLDMVSLTFSKEKPAEGDTVKVTATVRNNGTDYVGNFTVAFYYGGTKFSTEKAGPLTAGNQTQVAVDWRAVKGTHDMKAVADPDNKLAEVNEEDNSVTVSLTVKEKPGGADNNVLIVIAAVVVIALVAVAALWMIRARKAKGQ